MTKADLIMIALDNNAGDAQILDTFALADETPLTDEQQDVKVESVEQVDGRAVVKLSRALVSSDTSNDVNFDQPMYLLYAWHDSAASLSSQHTQSGASSERISLYDGGVIAVDAPLTNAYWQLHAVIMLVAWAVLPLPIVVLARYLKPVGQPWFTWHRALGFGVVILGVIGLCVAVVHHELGLRVSSHFVSAHGIVGLIVVVLAVAQAVIGYLADKMWSVDRKGVPIWPDKVHWMLGRVLALLGIVAVFLGAERRGAGLSHYLLLAAGVLVSLLTIIFMQVALGTGHHEEEAFDTNGITPKSKKYAKIVLIPAAILVLLLNLTAFLLLVYSPA